jgi:hypothetical protein
MKKIVYPWNIIKIILATIILVHTNVVVSQIDNFNGLPQFLYPEFSACRIKMKAGTDLNLLMNYNLITEKMVFFQKDQVYDLANPITVDTILMNNAKYIPHEKVFYEVHSGIPVTLFIQHRGRVQAPPKPAAYGGTSEVSSSSYISRIDIGTQVYNLKMEGDPIVKYDPTYWVKIDERMNNFTTEKQYMKIFPGKEELIKQYIKRYKLKFNKKDDLLKIWAYTNTIIK